jgi:DNA polymerase-3 subunit delta'
MAARGAVPHALLFVGPDGVGKTAAAIRTAQALNCGGAGHPEARFRAPGCSCRACRKIRAGVHPDVHRIAPDGPLIRIDRVRDLIGQLAMRPNEARVRIVVIERVGAMNPEAGNALLKLLEEPPDRTILILTARQPSELLPTLVSRCRTLRFAPPPRVQRAHRLAERLDISREDAVALAALEGLPPGDWREAQHRRRRMNWAMGAAAELLEGNGPPGLPLAFAERLAADKEGAIELLDVLTVWLRDEMVGRYATERTLLPAGAGNPGGPAARLSGEALLHRLSAVETARRRLQTNANARLALEVLALDIAESVHEESRRHSVQAGR